MPDEITPFYNLNWNLSPQLFPLKNLCTQNTTKVGPSLTLPSACILDQYLLACTKLLRFPQEVKMWLCSCSVAPAPLAIAYGEGWTCWREGSHKVEIQVWAYLILVLLTPKVHSGCYIVHADTAKKQERKRKENREMMGSEEMQRWQRILNRVYSSAFIEKADLMCKWLWNWRKTVLLLSRFTSEHSVKSICSTGLIQLHKRDVSACVFAQNIFSKLNTSPSYFSFLFAFS